MGLNTAKVDDFSGGLNLIDPAIELESSEYAIYRDMELEGSGKGTRNRRGILEFTPSTALPNATGTVGADSQRITVMKTYRLDQVSADQIMLSSGRGAVYRLNPNATNDLNTVIAPPGGPNPEYDMIQAQDNAAAEYVWLCNGVATPQKFRISTNVLSAWGGPPPNGTMMRVWKNRMIISGVAAQPQRLYYSDIANPESWPATNFIDIKSTDDEADPIMAIEVIGENLLVFKQGSCWLVFDPVGFENRRIGDVGCINRFCTAKYGELVYFISTQGIYSTDGDKTTYESKNIESVFKSSIGGNLGWSAGVSTPANTRLNLTWDNQLVMYNYSIGSVNNFQGVPDACYVMNLNMKRSDGQHPWTTFGGGFLNLSAFVRGHFLTHSAGTTNLYCIGVVNDHLGVAQRTVDVLKSSPTIQRNDTFGAVNNAVMGTLVRRMELQGNENLERIRRVNAFCQAYDPNISGSLGLAITSSSGASYGTVVSAVGSEGFLRYRPEIRGRYTTMTLTLFNLKLFSMEIKYRGGKEH